MKFDNKVAIEIVSDIDQCQRIWEVFVQPKSVWDLWQIRKTIIDVYKNKLHFVVGMRSGKIIGCLPLWFNKKNKKYEWVSGGWTEGNYPFVKDSETADLLLQSLDRDAVLEAIDTDKTHLFPRGTLIADYDHFGLDLLAIEKSWANFLGGLTGKKRQNIKRDIRNIERKNPKIYYDRDVDLERMFALNVSRMREKFKKNGSDLSIYEGEDSLDRKFIRKLWENRGNGYQACIICVKIGNKFVACDFNLIFNDIYYPIHGGEDTKSASGIGSYMNMLEITDAIKRNCSYVDYCMEDHHWKHTWFDSNPIFKALWSVNRNQRLFI